MCSFKLTVFIAHQSFRVNRCCVVGLARRIIFSLDPLTAETVGAAYVHVASEGGRASFSWNFDAAKRFEINTTIPHGEQGAVELLMPRKKHCAGSVDCTQCHVLTSNRTTVWKSTQAMAEASATMLAQHGIYDLEVGVGKLIVSVGSGEHGLILQRC